MPAVVGFRHRAVPDHQALSLPLLRQILEVWLPDFLAFSTPLLRGLPDHEA
ncbi:hypothetical protein [Thermus albus]|uniref:hypothetical protein n=1 Tax=Thermus albus TaxID=2908146 RepID=UPI001FAA9EDA|nr:hypothetical protein [Thermus albus]